MLIHCACACAWEMWIGTREPWWLCVQGLGWEVCVCGVEGGERVFIRLKSMCGSAG